MKNYQCTKYSSSSRRPSLFANVNARLAATVKIRRRKPYAIPAYAVRRRPLLARLTNHCRCLFEHLDSRWMHTVGKMAMAMVLAMVVYMVIGNSLQQSFTEKMQLLGVEKQEREKEQVLIQAELRNLVKKNQDRFGLSEGKPEQLIRMN